METHAEAAFLIVNVTPLAGALSRRGAPRSTTSI